MNRTLTRVLILLLLVVVGAAAYVYLVPPVDRENTDAAKTELTNPGVITNVVKNLNSGSSTTQVKQVGSSGIVKTNSVESTQSNVINPVKIMEELDELIADDDLNGAYKLAKKLMKNPDPDVRLDIAETFGWIGLKALAGLSTMLLDEDSEVASTARQHWESVVSDISDDSLKSQILREGIKVSNNKDDAESSIMLLDSLETSYCIRALVDIIENGSPASSEMAREHYEFTTDDPYTSKQTAEAWIKKDAAE